MAELDRPRRNAGFEYRGLEAGIPISNQTIVGIFPSMDLGVESAANILIGPIPLQAALKTNTIPSGLECVRNKPLHRPFLCACPEDTEAVGLNQRPHAPLEWEGM